MAPFSVQFYWNHVKYAAPKFRKLPAGSIKAQFSIHIQFK